jgi:hypothetical protein
MDSSNIYEASSASCMEILTSTYRDRPVSDRDDYALCRATLPPYRNSSANNREDSQLKIHL